MIPKIYIYYKYILLYILYIYNIYNTNFLLLLGVYTLLLYLYLY